uniref:Uncharacterized protein n=1 Tax=Anguilla anguilla TaxID=7936 RepID=A0A0E9SQM2_ANGAN
MKRRTVQHKTSPGRRITVSSRGHHRGGQEKTSQQQKNKL